MLRDSGQNVNLVVKRRLVLPPVNNLSTAELTLPAGATTMRINLTKTKKKDDFGLVLGCKIYVKEILGHTLADKDINLSEGDLINNINGISLDGMNLKEARKLLETVKERLELVITKTVNSKPPSVNNSSTAGDKLITNGHQQVNGTSSDSPQKISEPESEQQLKETAEGGN